MNIEPLIARINTLNKIMNEFGSSETTILSLCSQAMEKLAPILTDKDFTVVSNAIHTQMNVVERLYDTVIELNRDLETLEIEVKNEQSNC